MESPKSACLWFLRFSRSDIEKGHGGARCPSLARKEDDENVLNTNFCEISLCSLKDKNKLLILSAIDNLVKGAAGQAVQNMNVIFGYKENLGLL